MAHATQRLFGYAVLAAPLLSWACGGTTTGIPGDNDSGANHNHDAGSGLDAMGSGDTNQQSDTVTPGKDVANNDTGSMSTTYPASHPPMPQVESGGGPVVVAPNYIPILYPGDTYEPQIESFTMEIGQSTYWSTIVTQYGVEPATMGTPVILTSANEPIASGTISDSDIQTWLQNAVDSGPLVGTNSSNTIYALYFPSGVTITLPEDGTVVTSCEQFGGYHNSTTDPTTENAIVYAVIPRCGTFETAGGQMLAGIDAITGPASHEYIEAATDPLPETGTPAYVQPDLNDIIWEFVLGGGEIMDMCAQNPGAFYVPSDLPFTVQRGWSNSAAAASHDPCEPELPGEVYFNSIAVFPNILVTAGGQSLNTDAVSLTVGGSTTVPVDLYSEGPTSGPWTVQALDAQTLQGGPAALSFTWDSTSGENGQVLHLTITANSMPSQGIDGVVIVSQLGEQASLWVGMVAVQ
jgi:hypothetical protein